MRRAVPREPHLAADLLGALEHDARRCPRRAASAAAARPAGPAPTTTTRCGSARPRRAAASARAPCAGSARSGSASRRGSGRCRRCSRCSGGSSASARRGPCAASAGSVISARFMPNASATPSPIRRSASTRIEHPRRRDQRLPDAERRREVGDRVPRHGRRRHDVDAAVEGGRVADRDVHVVDEPGELGHDRPRRRRVGAQADAEREARSGRAHRVERLDGRSATPSR